MSVATPAAITPSFEFGHYHPTMRQKDRIILISANVAARLLVYGPLAAAAFVFMPLALPTLALSAAQPWLGQGAQVAGEWIDARFPKVMAPINWALNKWGGKIGGAKWWTHTGVIVGMIAAATVPVPGLLHAVFGKVPGFIGSIVGGAQGAWTQILPLALVTGLPLATKLSTNVFDRAFSHLGMGDILARRDADRLGRKLRREGRIKAYRAYRLTRDTPGAAGAPEVTGNGPVEATPTAPAVPAPVAVEVTGQVVPTIPSGDLTPTSQRVRAVAVPCAEPVSTAPEVALSKLTLRSRPVAASKRTIRQRGARRTTPAVATGTPVVATDAVRPARTAEREIG